MTMNPKGSLDPLKNTDNSKSEGGYPDINALKKSFKEKYDKMVDGSEVEAHMYRTRCVVTQNSQAV